MGKELIDDPADVWPRRRLLALLSLSAVCAPFAGARALSQSEAKTFNGGAWLLGDKLSLAALLYDQSSSRDLLDRTLEKAKKIANLMHVTITPFPPKGATKAASSAAVIHYLIQGDGAKIGGAVERMYGHEAGALYEAAIKSNLLIPLYGPEDTLGRTIAEVVAKRLSGTSVPRSMWGDVVALVIAKRPQSEVKSAVFKMHSDIANFFIPGSG